MRGNNLDYKKAYEELLEKEKEHQKIKKKNFKKKKKKIKKKEKERSIRHLIDNGIPKCIITSTSQSSSNHDSCQLQPSTWVGIPNFEDLLEKNGDKESSVLSLYRNSDTFTARNEYELYNFTNPIIRDALKLCGLEHEISIVSQEDIVGLQPDHWLLKSKTNYIGLIQVECNEDSFHEPKVIGQMFDYLMDLSYRFGKLQAFGLLLTYNKAMTVSTHDSLKSAAANIQTSALPDQISKTMKKEDYGTPFGELKLIKTYAAKDHLVMPFIKPIGNDDYNSTDFMDLISTAADTFSSKGYEHMDLHIRHICKYKKNEKCEYIFIDLSRVSKVTDKDQAKQRMINCILKDLEKIRYNHSLTDNEQPNSSIAHANLERFSNPFTIPLTPNDKSK
ncbi:hypothetical protein DDB_G0290897 [Dictyostelium discoideum AX4]|uniref:DUF5898 domain-containing protein n=1 Tax=Dictyostelium discoideum TaxID=44689 RepID=Q54FF9_DICDI|nr:hypothetical protein DDB_G0290897 [Dictyostelium discoideum AX4]EAL62013.1 hypothetical protein DDB_G0290897 [Dictyostelium discoideum AX4]|eukprot:XP_635512.1 hypothetical protein DDB_G0290897 [Dictyostelium discoideum AX4]